MKLPFFSKKDDFNDIYLGLFLKEQEGVVFVLNFKNQKMIIEEQKSFFYTNGWENLVNDIDEAIYEYEKYLNKNKIKTIFFLYSHFINEKNGSIKQPYLNKIKEIINDLDLEAIGFIECFEGITNWLQKKESSLLNTIFLEFDKTQLSVIFFKTGSLEYKKTVSRTENVIDDFFEAINDYPNKNIFPSRIIIYDSDGLDKIAEKIINFKFDKNYFVQIPKIEILKLEEIFKSLINTFENQLVDKPKEETFKEEKEKITRKNFDFFIGKDIEESFISEKISKKPFKFGLNFKLPHFSLPSLSFLSNLSFKLNEKIIIFLGGVLILIGLFINEFYFHKAQLTIYLPYKNIEKKLKSTINYEEKIINLNLKESVETTAKKYIGSKAKGKVTVHSFDDKEKIFSQGTVIEVNGLKFLLDNEIKVASSSLISDGSAKLPGKANVSVTAFDIGENYNLSKNQRFKIDNLSTSIYFAINEDSFSGGSKKQIKIFSLSDRNSLENKLNESIKKNKQLPKLSKNQDFISNLTTIKIKEKNFSKEIGEEAELVELNAEVEVVYITYNKLLLKEIVRKDLIKNLDEDYEINDEDLKIKIENSKLEKDKLNLNLDVKGKTVLKIKKDELLNKITGQNKDRLAKILKDNYKIDGFNLIISDNLPIIKNYLPWLKNNINLRFQTLD